MLGLHPARGVFMPPLARKKHLDRKLVGDKISYEGGDMSMEEESM